LSGSDVTDQKEFINALNIAVGADAVKSGDAVPLRSFSDWTGACPTEPLALVLPRNTEEVAAVLRLCTKYRVPVVPQGGLTGLAGAAVPVATGIALALDRMNVMESIDARASTITVQAGCTLQAVQQAAENEGLQFGVDLGARGSCQIGGNLSTNAGGNGVLQFGMMREQMLGLEVVLADGQVLTMLRPMIKNNTGYDLKHFFVGAEGTLGVITRAVLRLRPTARARITVLVALDSFSGALTLLSRLHARFPGAVGAFELMWRDFVDAALKWRCLHEPFDARHPLLALVDLTGDEDGALRRSVEGLLEDSMGAGDALDAVIAQSHAQARALWKIREATAELSIHMSPPLNFDVSLPMSEIGRFADACRAALSARWPGHDSLFFGHVGDGNLHISTDLRTVFGLEHELEKVVYDQVAAFGGSVSAEHGIGMHKKDWLASSRTPSELAAMRSIKRALDPLNLMNPGKLFDV
jgi:FAD/FMN-containing dehydrogenase